MFRNPAVLAISLLVLYLVTAILFLMALPQPVRPLEYLVAGAFAAAVCLMIGFAIYARSKLARTARKNERPS